MKTKQEHHSIQLIGVGLRGADCLCKEMLDRINAADLLVGGEKVLQVFGNFSGERIVIKGSLEGLDKKIRHARKIGKRVTVLTSGDPNFFGIAKFLLDSFEPDEVEIHPYVSSVQLAFARLKIPWEDAAFVSAHGRELDPVVHAVRTHAKVAILTDPKNHPARIAKVLLKAGIPDTRVFVCCRLGGTDEEIWEGTLASLSGKKFPLLNVMVVLNETFRSGGFGLADDHYAHEKGLITRSEVRAVTLSKLRIGAQNILWDIGAGSGSVSVEAAWMAQGVTVYAVEKSRKRISDLKKNVRRFGSGTIHAVLGEAPSVLETLPNPDRVFVGGSGGQLTEILQTSVQRLRRGGRIVINAVTLETLQQTREILKNQRLSVETVSVQIGRGRDLKGKVMLQAENQVFIISAVKR